MPSDAQPDPPPAPPANEARADHPAPLSDQPLSGRVVGGRWRVLDLVGRGGMGAVYEAQNVAIGKRVALKFIDCQPGDVEAIQRFQREAEAASAVESAHIVHVFDTGTTDEGQPYLVMELLRGESLGARLRRLGRLPLAEAIHVTAQILRGLARAHAAGVIHRDLKPDNVFLVDRDDDPLFVKLLDFGISKVTPGSTTLSPGTITKKGTVLGTPYYMSPEQAQAQPDLDERSDLFSVGAILFECLVGHAPWASLTSYEAVIVAICSRDTPDVRLFAPEAPAPLAAVVRRALARDRTERFDSALAFLEALRAAAPGLLSQREATSSLPTVSSLPPTEAAPATRTSWTSRDALAPTQLKPTPTERLTVALPLRRRVQLGAAAAALAFVGTWFAAVHRPPTPPAAASSAAPPAPPEVSLRIELSPPSATLLVDGQPAPDRVLRGAALSEHHITAEAPGYRPHAQKVRLDGRPSLRVELSPLPPAEPAEPQPPTGPATTAASSRPPPPQPPQPPASGASASPSAPASASPRPSASAPRPPGSAGGKGLQLKGKL